VCGGDEDGRSTQKLYTKKKNSKNNGESSKNLVSSDYQTTR